MGSSIKSLCPCIFAVSRDGDRERVVASRVGNRFYGFDLAACAGMDMSGNESVSFANALPFLTSSPTLTSGFAGLPKCWLIDTTISEGTGIFSTAFDAVSFDSGGVFHQY